MTVSGASAAGSYDLSQQIQSLTQHKRRPSISDVDMQSASATTAPSQSGKPGRKIDITA